MHTFHVRLDFTVSKSPLVPFNSTICPRNGPNRCQNALKMGHFGTKKESRMGQKHVFPKVIPDHLGCSNKCF